MTVFLDDIEVGTEYISESRTIERSDIDRFADLSGDFNPLHVDEEWVRTNTDFDRCIAHGLLMLAIGSGLKCAGLNDWYIQAYLAVERRMVGPTYPGDTVHARSVVTDVRRSKSRPGSGVVAVEVSLVNQNGETLQTGADTYLVGARP
jgi:3-hydroxybutyryl-CoA dehydratase